MTATTCIVQATGPEAGLGASLRRRCAVQGRAASDWFPAHATAPGLPLRTGPAQLQGKVVTDREQVDGA